MRERFGGQWQPAWRASQLFAVLIALAVSTALTAPARAATIEIAESSKGRLVLAVGGVITSADAEVVSTVLQLARRAHHPVQLLMVDSPGGEFAAGLEIADQVHRLGVPVRVRGGCFSACAFVALAARKLTVTGGGVVGVHQAYDLRGVPNLEATLFAAKLLRRYGVRAAAIGKMLGTPPDKLAILTGRELRAAPRK
jgi:membrane-bound ClpP family serine protease